MKRILAVMFLSCVGFLGCEAEPDRLDPDRAIRYSQAIRYVRDYRTNLCFAIVGVRETGKASSAGIGLSLVPCEKVNHVVIKGTPRNR